MTLTALNVKKSMRRCRATRGGRQERHQHRRGARGCSVRRGAEGRAWVGCPTAVPASSPLLCPTTSLLVASTGLPLILFDEDGGYRPVEATARAQLATAGASQPSTTCGLNRRNREGLGEGTRGVPSPRQQSCPRTAPQARLKLPGPPPALCGCSWCLGSCGLRAEQEPRCEAHWLLLILLLLLPLLLLHRLQLLLLQQQLLLLPGQLPLLLLVVPLPPVLPLLQPAPDGGGIRRAISACSEGLSLCLTSLAGTRRARAACSSPGLRIGEGPWRMPDNRSHGRI